MQLRLPKPLHGWRQFLGEVGIIVVGVLIALAAEQAIDNWNWQRKSSAAEIELRTELLASAAYSEERLRMSKCFESKLDQLQIALVEAEEPIRKPMFVSRYWTIVRLWSADAWETARASDVLTHMAPAKVREYAALYRLIDLIRANLALEQQYISDLALLTWFTGRVSETMRDRMLAAVTRARRANEMIIRDSKQVIAAAEKLGIKLSPKDLAPQIECGSLYEPVTA